MCKTIPLTSTYSISHRDLLDLKKNDLYVDILDTIIDVYKIEKSSFVWIDRILEYYVYPQNYNNLSYGSIYRDFHLYLNGGSLNVALKSLCEDNIVRRIEKDNNTYFLFTQDVERIINREINLNNLDL